uniref:Uncharacterized protein n=1 Tax=Cannabis sativa TaxID=3483 RepID=A0A803QCP5_CANSA
MGPSVRKNREKERRRRQGWGVGFSDGEGCRVLGQEESDDRGSRTGAGLGFSIGGAYGSRLEAWGSGLIWRADHGVRS